MTFQKTVVIIAIIVLLICLVAIGIALAYSKVNSYPDNPPTCPDYWTVDDSDPDKIRCMNVQNLGKCPAPAGSSYLTLDVGSAPYTGSRGNCAKYTWATNCEIAWDGITYGAPNPCSKLTDVKRS